MNIDPVGWMEIGFRMFDIGTVRVTFPVMAEAVMLPTLMTVFEVAVQVGLDERDPPMLLVRAPIVHVPVAIQRSEGRVMVMPAPTPKAFLILTVKV
jgi:hypothetical protein